jgi:transcription initiation factor IIE alpha subunit
MEQIIDRAINHPYLQNLKNTVQEKYGVDHVWQVKEIHQKTIDNTDKELSILKQKETVRQKTLKNLLPRLESNNLKLLSYSVDV